MPNPPKPRPSTPNSKPESSSPKTLETETRSFEAPQGTCQGPLKHTVLSAPEAEDLTWWFEVGEEGLDGLRTGPVGPEKALAACGLGKDERISDRFGLTVHRHRRVKGFRLRGPTTITTLKPENAPSSEPPAWQSPLHRSCGAPGPFQSALLLPLQQSLSDAPTCPILQHPCARHEGSSTLL